jgi:hypothetical protein
MARGRKVNDEMALSMWYDSTVMGMTQKDIAKKYKLNPSTVSESISRARDIIREAEEKAVPRKPMSITNPGKQGGLSLRDDNLYAGLNDLAQITEYNHHVGQYIGSIGDELMLSLNRNRGVSYEERMMRGGKAAYGAWQIVVGVVEAMGKYRESREKELQGQQGDEETG